MSVVTTSTLPRDRYAAAVEVRTPAATHGTGFAREGLDLAAYRRVQSSIFDLRSSIVHFTGVHAWNVPLVHSLRRRGVRVIHTLHDLDPHHGVRFAGLIRLWNRLIVASGCHILVHGRRYREQLLAQGVPADRVTYAPLLHGFLAADRPWPPVEAGELEAREPEASRNAPRNGTVLFFGRIEPYKGADTLLEAWRRAGLGAGSWRLVIAGPAARSVTLPPLPPGVELRTHRIGDDEADALFRSADLLVLPYRDATQSALIAAAYAYGRPVIVTRAGALPEYVDEGVTGWVVPPDDGSALAGALIEAAADPAHLRRLGRAGWTWFEAQRRYEQRVLGEMYGWT